jgi:outer membrane protein assembly factor BamE (lipoprotein component of BamABCDE complex)
VGYYYVSRQQILGKGIHLQGIWNAVELIQEQELLRAALNENTFKHFTVPAPMLAKFVATSNRTNTDENPVIVEICGL